MRIATLLGAGVALLLFGNTAFSQQLKLGLNPYTIQKSALLELSSTNQGLLLARITDTSLINALSPPDGMVIFFTPTKQLMVRSNGSWQAFTASGGALSSLNGLTTATQTFATGTAGTDFGISSLGTVHTFNLPDASAAARGVVTTTAQTFTGTKSFYATNPLNLFGVAAGTSTTTDSLLTITSGTVRKIPMSTFATSPGITSLNGLTTATQTFATGNTGTDFSITSSGSAHTFNIPDASAAARGLVTTGLQIFTGAKSIYATNPLNLFGVSTGTTTTADSLLTITSGTVRKIPLSTFATPANFWALGGNSPGSVRTLGTLDNNALPFITNGAERMRINNGGQVGIGVTDPANPLVVKDTLEIRRVGALSELLFSNTASTGDFRIGGDGGDIFWQGGGGRNLQMGAFWGVVLAGDRQSGSFPSFINGNSGTGVLVQGQRDASVPLGIQANSASQSANLTEWRSSTGTVLSAVDKNGNFGIGTTAPGNKLQINGANPISLYGVQLGTNTSTDSVLTIASGIVKKLPASTFLTTGSVWATGGNTVGSVKNLGTLDAFALPFITNGVERMRISSTGSVGIGTSAFDPVDPEKFLVDAGTTTSFNVMEAHGRINNYLQINIQNDSAGTASSSDLVATANNGTESLNFVDLGINSSAFTGTGVIGGANNAYLYSTGNDFAIGNGTLGKSLMFFTGGVGSNERMRIDGLGKVGIGTTVPAATLDVAGNFKTGATGTVQKNVISYTYTVPAGGLAVPAGVTGTVIIIGSVTYTSGTLDVNSTIPAASLPTTTRASVDVSPDADLPAHVSIASARLSTTSNVKIRFLNGSTTATTLPAGMNLYITIQEF
jgi:hypothetical protein